MAEERWKCQLLNHQRYCERHGYTCYFIVDSDHWKEVRLKIPTRHNDYWLKLQVLPRVLHQHPWMLYMDADTIFAEPELAPPIETMLAESAKNRSLVSLYMPSGKGWNTDLMFFRNTPWSKLFLEHVWSLRFACPHLNGEQGAAIMALFDALVHHLHTSQPSVATYDVEVDQGRTCCVPINHCEYPEGGKLGLTATRNSRSNVSHQGCTWNWQSDAFFNPDTKSKESKYLTPGIFSTRHILSKIRFATTKSFLSI